MAEDLPEFPLLSKAEQKFIQKVTGKFLYLGRAIDSTLLTPLSAIAPQQAAPTHRTMQHTYQLLDYIASQEDAVVTYHASEMILAAHSDASYLSERGARSRAGGHFYLSEDKPRGGRHQNQRRRHAATFHGADSRVRFV